MRIYNQITFSQMTEILMQAAMGVSAVCGCKLVTSDMVYSLSYVCHDLRTDKSEPYYVAIREAGTENGKLEYCLQRCKLLGYPLVIAKIEKDKVSDFNMTITFTHGWVDKNINYMEQEFNSL